MSGDGQSLELLNLLLLVLRSLRSAIRLNKLVLSTLHVASQISREATSHDIGDFPMLLLLLLVLLLLLNDLLSSTLLALKVSSGSSLVIIILVSMFHRLVKNNELLLVSS